MFGCFTSFARRSPVVARRLSLESLEARDCPTPFYTGALPVNLNTALQAQQTNGPVGQYTVSMFYTLQAGQNVEVSGTVAGPGAANQVVEFEGPINGYTVTDANGKFDFTTPANYLGNLLAAVIPPGPQGPNGPPAPSGAPAQSNVAQLTLADQPPVITNLAVTQLSSVTYEFTGMVVNGYVQGLTVTFGGQVQQIQGLTAVVGAGGSFELIVNLTDGSADNGLATAQILADNWGFSSNQAATMVNT